jgi:CRISPR-associated endoribonuclease Cas6
MRLKITLNNGYETALPVNYQAFLTAAIYRLLGASDAEYARFLHDEGYQAEEGPRRFKLFVFSNLRANRRRVVGETLWLGPGRIEWLIASPVEPFLTHIATGLLAVGVVSVGPASFEIAQVETLPSPEFGSGPTRFTCLSPMVAAVNLDGGGTRYLRPAEEGEAFSEAIRRNLLRKHQVLYGQPPVDDRFTMVFDADYLATHRGGTKKITYKAIDIIGRRMPGGLGWWGRKC